MTARPHLLFAHVLLICGLAACGGEAPAPYPHCAGITVAAVPAAPEPADSPTPSPAVLGAWVDLLAAPGMKGRHSLAPEGRATAVLLAGQLRAFGLAAPWDASYCRPFALQGTTAYNVTGLLSSSATAPRPAVLVGAHYDGQGMHPAGLPYPSADDNASGIAALVEVARLAARRSWSFDLVVAAFGGEEVGIQGSRAWLDDPPKGTAHLRLMINFDMVGRPWPVEPRTAIGYLTGGAGAESVAARLAEASATTAVEIRRLDELFDPTELRSDNMNFSAHMPTLYLSTGLHEDHHERTDTPERVDTAQIARAVRLTLALLEKLDEKNSVPSGGSKGGKDSLSPWGDRGGETPP